VLCLLLPFAEKFDREVLFIGIDLISVNSTHPNPVGLVASFFPGESAVVAGPSG
jgi:hypothetical protein